MMTLVMAMLLVSVALHGAPAPKKSRDFIVVIDPGHGGVLPGANNGKVLEKTINLVIAKKLRDKIEKGCTGVKVLMTRTEDVDVDLYKRSDLARNNKADLFISIHLNSFNKKAKDYPTRKGCEVYILGPEGSKENLHVIEAENADAAHEKNTASKYEMTPEEILTASLMQNTLSIKSARFGREILKEMKARAGRANRGLRQDNLYVLRKTNCPAVLIEADYMGSQCDFLNSEEGQEKIAEAIYQAFRTYHNEQIEEAKAAAKKK